MLVAGANRPLPETGALTVSLTGRVDPIALLLDAGGTADGDDGVVLFSHPVAAGGAVRLDGDTVTVERERLTAAIDRVLVVAQADGADRLPACTATISAGGTVIDAFALDAPPALPTVRMLELYRRGGGWKVRALGDGYKDGLKRLLEVHGVEVLDDEPAPPPATARVDMRKPELPTTGSVSLKKGEGVSLVKQGRRFTELRMGLGWDPAEDGKSIDLDASCVLLTAAGKKADAVWFMRTKGKSGALTHTGDNLTGKGDGDDESILVDLSKVPEDVVLIAFTVNSFSGQSLASVKNAFCRLLDGREELVRFDLTDFGRDARGVVMATLEREQGGDWSMTARGVPGKGRTYKGLMDEIKACLP